MTITDWTVVAVGLAAIVLVNWYFFVAGRPASRSGPPRGERGE